MFNTTIATKKYVPVQDRAKLYAFGGISPRAKRFVACVRQLVHHDGGKDVALNQHVCRGLTVSKVDRYPESPTLDDIIAKTQSK